MTRRAVVLGSPIAHSLSPTLHGAAYAAAGLDWRYDAVECDAAGLPGVLGALAGDPDWAGASLTMPLKLAVLPLLAGLDRVAAQAGAVNTVLPWPDGPIGYNTDVAGIVATLGELGVSDAAPAVVLGAGGTARAAVVALAALGAGPLLLAVRHPLRAAPVAEVAAGAGRAAEIVSWGELPGRLDQAAVVVSTVPAGASDSLARRGWPSHTALLDVVYSPWPTALGLAALAAGAPVAGGLPVLVHQAAAAFTLMTGEAAPLEVMRAAGEAALVR